MIQSSDIQISIEDPATADITALLTEHLRDMAKHSPPESVHALDIESLQRPNISFYAARLLPQSPEPQFAGELLGCAALKVLDDGQGELKSMRTCVAHLRKGVAVRLLDHIAGEARSRGMGSLSLETGTPDAFLPARKLYLRFGFKECAPFADYQSDPYSVCMRYLL